MSACADWAGLEEGARRWCNDDEVQSPRVQTEWCAVCRALAQLAVLVQHSRAVSGATYVPPPGCEDEERHEQGRSGRGAHTGG